MLTRTKGQLRLEKLLNQLGFETILEYRLGPYSVDIFLAEQGIAVEFDGPSHGLRKKKDAERDKELVETYRVSKVIRITEKDLATSAQLKERILTALSDDGPVAN